MSNCGNSKLTILNSKVNKLPENPDQEESIGRFPKWLHRQIPKGGSFFKTDDILRKYQLNTVCEELNAQIEWSATIKKQQRF